MILYNVYLGQEWYRRMKINPLLFLYLLTPSQAFSQRGIWVSFGHHIADFGHPNIHIFCLKIMQWNENNWTPNVYFWTPNSEVLAKALPPPLPKTPTEALSSDPAKGTSTFQWTWTMFPNLNHVLLKTMYYNSRYCKYDIPQFCPRLRIRRMNTLVTHSANSLWLPWTLFTDIHKIPGFTIIKAQVSWLCFIISNDFYMAHVCHQLKIRHLYLTINFSTKCICMGSGSLFVCYFRGKARPLRRNTIFAVARIQSYN